MIEPHQQALEKVQISHAPLNKEHGYIVDSQVYKHNGLRGHTYRLLQGPSRLRRRSGAFSVRIVKYWNRLPAHRDAFFFQK